MSWQRINIEDNPLFEKLLPVQAFFNAIPDSDFSNYIRKITQGEGIGLEGVTSITFPNNLDEFEVYNYGFDGVAFTFFEEEIVVDVPTFRKYLRIACEAYWAEHPETRATLEEYLARPQPPLEEGASEDWKKLRDAGKYAKPISDIL